VLEKAQGPSQEPFLSIRAPTSTSFDWELVIGGSLTRLKKQVGALNCFLIIGARHIQLLCVCLFALQNADL
jgi:hypothetical protein